MGTLQQSQTKKIEANAQKQGASSNNEHLQSVDELHELVGNQALGHQIKSQNHLNQTTDSSPNLLFRQISTANNSSIQRQPLFRGLSHELIGNGQQGSLVQAKLTINQPDDRYEQEADRVAAEVVKQIHAPVSQPVAQTKATQNNDLIQKAVSSPRTVANGMSARPQVETVIQRLQEQASAVNLDASIQQARGSGESLGVAQTSMEKAFGADFSGVRIHHNSKSDRLSRSIQARAFTTGQDIFFRKGEYAPNSRSGQHLLAHELTHVMQQNKAAVQRKSDRSITPSPPQISRAPGGSMVGSATDFAGSATDFMGSATTQSPLPTVQELVSKNLKSQSRGAEEIYEANIHAPILVAIERKLGFHRRAFRRSKKLNIFRQRLKDAARGQANLDIDSLVKDVMRDEGKEESEAFQELYATRAKSQAYSEVKSFVDEAIKTIALEITDAVVPRAETCEILEQFARQAASEYKTPTEAMLAIAKEIVKVKVDKKGSGFQQVRDITKGSQTEQKLEELGNKIKAEVSGDDKKFTKTILKKVIESDTLDQGFEKLGKIVDFLVPNPGCSCEVDIEIKVPFTPPGVYPIGYLIARVVGSAEKDSEDGKQAVETKLNVSLGGGLTFLELLDINVKVGLFFKSNAETSQKALQLVSYGFYRKLKSAKSSAVIADTLWTSTSAGKAQKTMGESAEIWAAAMEELLFYERGKDGKVVMENDQKKRNDVSVEVGGLVEAKGKGNAGFATIEGEGQYKRGSLFSAETLGDGLGVHNKTSDQLQKANAGQSRNTFIIKSEAEIKALGSGFGVGLEGKIVWNRQGFYEFEVEAFGKANTQWSDDSKTWQSRIASIGGSVASLIKNLVDIVRAKNPSYGTLGGAFSDVGFTDIDQLQFSDAGKTLGKQLTELTPEGTDSVTGEASRALGAKQSLKLALKLAGTRTSVDKPFAQSLEISVTRLREIGFEHELAGFGGKVKVETGEKIVRGKWRWLGLFRENKLGGNFLGVGNLGNQGKKIFESEV